MPKWLKCKIDKGMFSDEFTVTVHTRTGEAVAVFVPKAAAIWSSAMKSRPIRSATLPTPRCWSF